ncbi:S26 family signal peptidase [Nocardioides baculatus]|uniref:S26 family signal peptidase n=1 Tax=Nocardioides baculatus TaxID=2801337 RepID=A0ABS1L7I6_9ACTN|nr:S26 family signal peptidase [Nocardioides baculatus]MBL0747625.1 S26 family signal peptidase [Nocardioides baculatus]
MSPRSAATPRTVPVVLGVVVLLIGVGVATSWLLAGGRWLRMDTPSMGTAAPVGSLLWVRPVELEDVAVGDLVTVRPADAGGRTYTHRVVSTTPRGLRTGGVLSGEDPWVIDQARLVGRVDHVWPVLGLVLRLAPLLLALLLAAFLAPARLPERWRLPVRIVGVSLALSVVLVVHQPLTDARMLAFDTGAEGARTTWVNAGQVPLRLRAPSTGASATMGPGETATVAVARTDARGRYVVSVRPDLPGWTWWLVGGPWVLLALGHTLRERRTLHPA